MKVFEKQVSMNGEIILKAGPGGILVCGFIPLYRSGQVLGD